MDLEQMNARRPLLESAFNRVLDNPAEWKGPINKVVVIENDADMALVREAVVFFTASVPTFTAKGKNRYLVKAAGYYAAVGA